MERFSFFDGRYLKALGFESMNIRFSVGMNGYLPRAYCSIVLYAGILCNNVILYCYYIPVCIVGMLECGY